MTTSPKVKPIMGWAAVCDGIIRGWSMRGTKDTCQDVIGLDYPGGWAEAESLGYRIIRVRIEPVEE